MKHRFSVAALATILFCIVSLNPTPSIPAVQVQPAMTVFEPVASTSTATPTSRYATPSAETAEMQRRVLSTLPYGSIIAVSAERNRIDSLLLAAMVDIESGFTAAAVSPQGARGLMQIRRATALSVGHDGDLLDPHTNVEVGSRYLGTLLHDFDGDVQLSLAAYNAGPSAVVRHNGIPPYRETREYVRKVLDRYQDLRREATALEAGLHSADQQTR